MVKRERRGGRRAVRDLAWVMLLAAATGCNAVTGASEYRKSERCAGPACGKCKATEFVDPSTGYCSACPTGTQACGGTCCAAGHACNDAATSACAPCDANERACGMSCCGEGQRCDEKAGKCIVDCATVGGKNCGSVCCYGAQVCDEAKGACACDPNSGAASTETCGATCCGLQAPNCVDDVGGPRCSPCKEAVLECGPLCRPPAQTCLNKKTGAFGAEWGTSKQSCAKGLVCSVSDGKGGKEMADCCESIVVPEATFTMGGKVSEVNGEPKNDGASYRATVSTYSLDRFEVTVGRFRAFVEAYDGLVAQGLLPEGAGANRNVVIPEPGTGWQTKWNANLPKSQAELLTNVASCGSYSTYTKELGGNETKPITCVTWYQAFAFCAWDGGRLPTEAEWEMAASNGAQASVYPWGDGAPTDDLAVFAAWTCFDIPPSGTCPNNPLAVGSTQGGANQLGHRDLIGNANEWTLDSYTDYPTLKTKDHVNIDDLASRVFRGGSFAKPPMSAADRKDLSPIDTFFIYDMGLRCARTP